MTDQEPRKATDVLLSLEQKIDELLGIVRNQDLNSKIMSNKLNELITTSKQQANKIIVETQQTPMHANFPQGFTQLPAGDPERHIPISAENTLPQTNSPEGFRRNSRPETYANEKQAPQMPIQLPRQPQQANQPPPGRSADDVIFPEYAEVQVPAQTKKANRQPPPMPEMMQEQPTPQALQGQVPVSQRCVDKNGKSIFLADVEVVDMATQQQVFKGRTSAVGKWSVPLGIGEYRVAIKKRDALTKQQLEAIQDVRVSGKEGGKLELPMIIIR